MKAEMRGARSQSHAAPCAAWRWGAPGGALPRTQKVLWNSYPHPLGSKRNGLLHICPPRKLEEDIFYPAIQAQLPEDGPDLVEEAIKEHNEMKRLISQLQTGGLVDTDYDGTVHQLMRGVQHHVREEENEMLPRAEQQLGNTIEQLGIQMQQRKQQLLGGCPRINSSSFLSHDL